jgi:hypothetical protein
MVSHPKHETSHFDTQNMSFALVKSGINFEIRIVENSLFGQICVSCTLCAFQRFQKMQKNVLSQNVGFFGAA